MSGRLDRTEMTSAPCAVSAGPIAAHAQAIVTAIAAAALRRMSTSAEMGPGLVQDLRPICGTNCHKSQELRSRALEQRRRALPAADTHRDDAVADLAATHLARQRADEPRAGHPERMADGDRAAID